MHYFAQFAKKSDIPSNLSLKFFKGGLGWTKDKTCHVLPLAQPQEGKDTLLATGTVTTTGARAAGQQQVGHAICGILEADNTLPAVSSG